MGAVSTCLSGPTCKASQGLPGKTAVSREGGGRLPGSGGRPQRSAYICLPPRGPWTALGVRGRPLPRLTASKEDFSGEAAALLGKNRPAAGARPHRLLVQVNVSSLGFPV